MRDSEECAAKELDRLLAGEYKNGMVDAHGHLMPRDIQDDDKTSYSTDDNDRQRDPNREPHMGENFAQANVSLERILGGVDPKKESGADTSTDATKNTSTDKKVKKEALPCTDEKQLSTFPDTLIDS